MASHYSKNDRYRTAYEKFDKNIYRTSYEHFDKSKSQKRRTEKTKKTTKSKSKSKRAVPERKRRSVRV